MLTSSYNKNVTIRKSYEINIHEDLPTPMIIVCTDPPHNSNKTNIIEILDAYKECINKNLDENYLEVLTLLDTTFGGLDPQGPPLENVLWVLL